MEKFTVNNIVEFNGKKDETRRTFLNKLAREEKLKKERKEKKEKSGGDYWISCVSAISNVFINNDKNLLELKAEELYQKIEYTTHKPTVGRWQKNIEILSNFEDFDFNSIKPSGTLEFHQKRSSTSILKIHDIPIEAKPQHVFSFKNNDFDEIGALWFIAKKDGYKKGELGIFCDLMNRYLSINYSSSYKINPKFCIAVDVVNASSLSYNDLLSGDVMHLLENAAIEIKKLLTSIR